MLYLVGIGLNEEDLTMSTVELCRRCETYIERFTSYIDDERVAYLERAIGKPLKELDRSAMEEDAWKILSQAKERDVAILVGGDPLVATTHKILFIEAKKQKVKMKIRHAPSIISALMGESGLDFYKFGAICTISRWHPNYTPVSFYETISKNIKNGNHSIVLLDYEPKTNSSLELDEALRILQAAEKKYKGKIVKDNTLIFIMHSISLKDEQKVITTVKRAKQLRFSRGPTAIILPAKMSDIEKETLGSMYNVTLQ